MSKQPVKRRSHCVVCGKRLSEKTETGDIRWRTSHIGDTGIICEMCVLPGLPARNDAPRTKDK